MPPDLLALAATDEEPEHLIARSGRVLARFDHRTQDSGNVSWLVSTPSGSFFVKSAGEDGPPPSGAPVPYLDHAGRVALLRTAIEIGRGVPHPALARLRNVIESGRGPMLVYDGAPGELLHAPADRRQDPSTAYRRFAAAPARIRLAVLDDLIDAQVALEEHGWVAADLYDGCLIVDLRTARLTLIDLDTYRRGPTRNEMGRMFGSTRFMAPEEHELGAPIDARTTVFTLGRLVRHFGTGLSEELADFAEEAAGEGARLAEVAATAVRPAREERFGTVAEMGSAWRSARSVTHAAPSRVDRGSGPR